jgi:hypothetical protein
LANIFNKIAGEKGLTPFNVDYWLNEYARWDVDREEDSEDLEFWKLAVKMLKEALIYKDVFCQYTEIAGRSLIVSVMIDGFSTSNYPTKNMYHNNKLFIFLSSYKFITTIL